MVRGRGLLSVAKSAYGGLEVPRRRLWMPTRPALRNAGGCGCCTPTPTPTPTCACGSCNIPETNYTITWTSFTTGSTALVYSGTSCTWLSGCTQPYGAFSYTLNCAGSNPNLIVTSYSGSVNNPCSGVIQTCSVTDGGLTVVSFTCSPFSVTLQPNISSPCGFNLRAVFIQWVIS
jgi:hypothetical protein